MTREARAAAKAGEIDSLERGFIFKPSELLDFRSRSLV
jgi:hypothetical protein